jgi:hypothetical protein
VWQVGLIDRRSLLPWVAAAPVSLAAFGLGLRVQDRLLQETFDRAVLGLLALTRLAMLARALRP